ncbi:MAG: hypothetical protein GX994_03050 [Firmicutes bacterium]|nr:hypothetical protein [Bacillota bacterium]
MGISQAWKLVINALKAAWNEFTTLIFLNLIWFFLWLAPMFISSRFTENEMWFYISLALSLFLLGPITGAMQYLLNRMANKNVISFEEFKHGFIKFFWRSEALVFVGAFTLVVIVICFNITVDNLGLPPIVVAIFYGIWLSLTLFWFLILQYAFPLLVEQDVGVFLTIKRAVLLAADNLLVSLLLLIASGVLTYVSFFLVIPFVIIWFSMIGLMQNFIVVEILKKYNSSYSKE